MKFNLFVYSKRFISNVCENVYILQNDLNELPKIELQTISTDTLLTEHIISDIAYSFVEQIGIDSEYVQSILFQRKNCCISIECSKPIYELHLKNIYFKSYTIFHIQNIQKCDFWKSEMYRNVKFYDKYISLNEYISDRKRIEKSSSKICVKNLIRVF